MPSPADRQYERLPIDVGEIAHRYGPQVHILSRPHLMTILARLASAETPAPMALHLVRSLYRSLLEYAVDRELPRTLQSVPSRMAVHHGEGVYRGELLDPATRVITVGVARAGLVPSQICFETLLDCLDRRHVRQDHVFISRKTDAGGRVIGSDLSGSKIGGIVKNTVVFIPDPMGATASSMCAVVDLYKKHHGGPPAKILALHAIVTPEYLRRMTADHPEVHVYTVRLDRGLSPPDVLSTPPGTHWDRECGLNDHQYIVPGAGGIGEVLNNAEI